MLEIIEQRVNGHAAGAERFHDNVLLPLFTPVGVAIASGS